MEKNKGNIWEKIFIPPLVLEINGTFVYDQQNLVENLAIHFQSVSSSDKYDPLFKVIRNNETHPDFSTNEDLFCNTYFSFDELNKALQESNNTAPGPDNIPYEFIRQLPVSEKLKILNLFNRIWQEGIYPDKWKNATIIPLLKPNKDPLKPESYRPISLTCCLGKLLEKMINYRLVWCLEKRNLLSEYQMGSRKYRSTVDHLVFLENAVQNSFLNRSHLVAIFFRFGKSL